MLAVNSIIWPWGTGFLSAVVSCLVCVFFARSKGFAGGKVALLGLLGFVLPLIGIIVVAVLPRRTPPVTD